METYFPGRQAAIYTQIDGGSGLIHNHIIICNVSLIDQEFCEHENKTVPINDYNLLEKGTKTKDWDWRTNLKKYDVIDCFDRNRWYPATIVEVNEIEINGYRKIIYKVAFRLYIEHFKNLEDEENANKSKYKNR